MTDPNHVDMVVGGMADETPQCSKRRLMVTLSRTVEDQTERHVDSKLFLGALRVRKPDSSRSQTRGPSMLHIGK